MKLWKYHAGTRRSRSATPPAIGLLVLAATVTLAFAGSAVSAPAPATAVNMGNAESFGALSSAAMTNAGANTVVHGDVGSSTSIDAGVTHPGYGAYGAGTPELANAQASLLTAYGAAEAQAPSQPTITGTNLAGLTLDPGVYNSTSGILIDGPIPLTLDGNGNPDAVFIFQAASSGNLIVESTSSVRYTNGAQPCNIWWKVNSAFLRNTDHTFIGTILALTQITLTENITVEGRVLARNADVTFIHDTIIKPTCAAVAPPPPPPPPPPGPPAPPPPPISLTSTPTLAAVKPLAGGIMPPASRARPSAPPAAPPTATAPPRTTPRPPTPRPPRHHVGLTG